MTEKFLDRSYGMKDAGAVRRHYADWSNSYDAELTENGYATPRRCAQALAQFARRDVPILDFGCGTGLSGAALAEAGFGVIDGTDITPEMLANAERRGVYRHSFASEIGAPPPHGYDAIAAIGVIGAGAAPLSVLDQIVAALPSGGHTVFSFNDHTLDDPAYADAIRRLTEAGIVTQVFEEHGDHIPGIDLKSTVYVLRKT